VFWRASFEAEREQALRVLIHVELAACRDHARRADDAPTFRWATVRLARILWQRGLWQGAHALLEDIPDADRDAEYLFVLADVEDSLGHWQLARIYLTRALATFPEGTKERAATLHQMAGIDLRQGRYAEARSKLLASMEIDQAIGNHEGVAATLHSLASINLEEGNYEEARLKYEKSLHIREVIGDLAGAAVTLHSLATVDLNERNYEAARAKFAKVLQVTQSIGDHSREAAAWHQLGTVDLETGDWAAARANLEKARQLRLSIGDIAGEAGTLHQLGLLDLKEGKSAGARVKLRRALHISQDLNSRHGEAGTMCLIGILAEREGRPRTAAVLMAISCLILKAIGHRDFARTSQNFAAFCGKFGYDRASAQAVLADAEKAYRSDRGRSLIDEVLQCTPDEPVEGA